MKRSKIIGVGSFVPPTVFTNHDLEKMMNTSDEWIVQRTGIKERRWVQDGESTSDLALNAANEAIKNAGINKEEIDMIIFATISPDHEFPGTGCFLQAKLNLPGIPAIDIRQQCSGFVYGLSIADSFIRTGQFKKILLIGAEVHSSGLNKTPEGRDISVLFGDGAGAVIISECEVNDPNKDPHIISTYLHADGSFAKELWICAPGTGVNKNNVRLDHSMLDQGLHYPHMNGKKVFTNAVKRMCEVTLKCLDDANLKPNDVDLYLFHQANLRINEALAERLEIHPDKVFHTIQKYANTTAATIPIGMNDAIKASKLKPGMLVGLAAFGSGFTWCAGLIRF
ncbi:MAG TPA: 3-oxoacyl-ACP synthase [Marinilabiliales bacterium]|nr:3-oxoacyl-ACP synthase [Marinilabiliales bacterium]